MVLRVLTWTNSHWFSLSCLFHKCVGFPKMFSSVSDFNPLEIQQVHPKGDQSWVFIGRTDAEAETPILWPPHAKI